MCGWWKRVSGCSKLRRAKERIIKISRIIIMMNVWWRLGIWCGLTVVVFVVSTAVNKKFGIHDNTLYYTLSTIPQVLVAAAAVLAAFMFFKLNAIRDYLVGEGEAALARSKDDEPGYKLCLGDLNKLRDAVFRKNPNRSYGIEEMLRFLSKEEEESKQNPKDEKETEEEKKNREKAKENRENLKKIYNERYKPTLDIYNKLHSRATIVVGFLFVSIVLSVICLAFVDSIKTIRTMAIMCVSLNTIFLVISLGETGSLIGYGLLYKVAYEEGEGEKS